MCVCGTPRRYYLWVATDADGSGTDKALAAAPTWPGSANVEGQVEVQVPLPLPPVASVSSEYYHDTSGEVWYPQPNSQTCASCGNL